jgi:MerR family redox-sensitive transcriptional activator SoxR
MGALPDLLTIGELSQRSGAAPSALRFYERLGLIRATRTGGNQRRYERAALRRVAFVLAARHLGVPLEEVRKALATLPSDRTPRAADWARLSARWRSRLDERIAEMHNLRDKLTSCIGCGCLSLQRCKLLNRDDTVALRGAGPRLLYPKGVGSSADVPDVSGAGSHAVSI